jgi:hypothetical protein
MTESRHNSHLIVTVLTACVALMCGVPAASGANANAARAEVPGRYLDLQRLNGEARSAPTVGDERSARGATALTRLRNFKTASLLQLLDLAAVLPGFKLVPEPAAFDLELGPVDENTRTLNRPIDLLTITRLPRAGLI